MSKTCLKEAKLLPDAEEFMVVSQGSVADRYMKRQKKYL
jgi:hypothetical protein